MNRNLLLTVTSLLAALLLSFHLAEDVVRGFEPGGPKNLIGIAVLVAWLIGALLLNGRLAGYIIMLLAGLLGGFVPYVHMSGAGMVGGRIEGSSGILFWVWTLIAAGALSLFSAILSGLGLWDLFWTRRESKSRE
jgi:hypothetical protein